MSGGDQGWQVGDIALCIDAHTPTEDGYLPELIEEGCVYTVYAIGLDLFGDLGLFLDEVESLGHAGGFLARRFIKITPPEADEFDLEVLRLMTSTPVEA